MIKINKMETITINIIHEKVINVYDIILDIFLDVYDRDYACNSEYKYDGELDFSKNDNREVLIIRKFYCNPTEILENEKSPQEYLDNNVNIINDHIHHDQLDNIKEKYNNSNEYYQLDINKTLYNKNMPYNQLDNRKFSCDLAFLILSSDWCGYRSISTLCVRPSYISNGIGTMLMKYVLKKYLDCNFIIRAMPPCKCEIHLNRLCQFYKKFNFIDKEHNDINNNNNINNKKIHKDLILDRIEYD